MKKIIVFSFIAMVVLFTSGCESKFAMESMTEASNPDSPTCNEELKNHFDYNLCDRTVCFKYDKFCSCDIYIKVTVVEKGWNTTTSFKEDVVMWDEIKKIEFYLK